MRFHPHLLPRPLVHACSRAQPPRELRRRGGAARGAAAAPRAQDGHGGGVAAAGKARGAVPPAARAAPRHGQLRGRRLLRLAPHRDQRNVEGRGARLPGALRGLHRLPAHQRQPAAAGLQLVLHVRRPPRAHGRERRQHSPRSAATPQRPEGLSDCAGLQVGFGVSGRIRTAAKMVSALGLCRACVFCQYGGMLY